jgi:nucleoside-diphosphate-sugar epimerase
VRQTALVTGSSGFLGRHFSDELRSRDFNVVECDTAVGVNALDLFRRDVEPNRYDLVVHCAAVEPHRAAIDSLPDHLAANLQLDSAMFRWALRTRQRRVLYISSSAVYPVRYQQWVSHAKLREEHTDADEVPFDDYGWLKLTGERMAKMLNGAGVPVHVVRPFSGYGEDQSTNFPFGAFRERAKARQDPFEIWGDATQVRDWIHVSDVVKGALAIVDADERRPVNLCTGTGTSMLGLSDLFTRAAGYQPEVKVLKNKPMGVSYRVGNPYRMLRHYVPEVSIEAGVERAMSSA